MAIVANTVTENGDVLFIKSDIAAVGLIALTGFVDETQNENYPYLYFSKTFRYSLDGITWSSWRELTVPNITSISVNPYDVFFVEYRYERKGVLGLENLEFDSATIDATYEPQSCGIYFTNSYFSKYFDCNDIEVLGWYLNVTEKLFNTGVLAQYLPRKNEDGNPEDFLIFWKSISKFFAYYVIYSRKFQNFYQTEDLVREYLIQRGLNVSNSDDLMTLNALMNTFTYEISKRGTINVYDKDSAVKGEILRLIFFEEFDEFIFNYHIPEHFGWTLNRSSPLYRGLDLDLNANKWYEKSRVTNLDLYPIIQSGASTITIIEDSGLDVVSLDHNDADVGFGQNGNIDDLNAFKITVNPNIVYDLSFKIKYSGDLGLTAGANIFDKNLNALNLKSIVDGTTLNNFIVNKLGYGITDWHELKFYIYPHDTVNNSVPISSNANFGTNLKFDINTSYIIPKIILDSPAECLVKDIKFKPAYTDYSRGFLNVKNYISVWLVNRNQKYNTEQLEDYMRRYLIPYNSNIKITSL